MQAWRIPRQWCQSSMYQVSGAKRSPKITKDTVAAFTPAWPAGASRWECNQVWNVCLVWLPLLYGSWWGNVIKYAWQADRMPYKGWSIPYKVISNLVPAPSIWVTFGDFTTCNPHGFACKTVMDHWARVNNRLSYMLRFGFCRSVLTMIWKSEHVTRTYVRS